ncbi:MAG TPA: acyltransferase [Baekduia sp.]|nr:acyltransferase [Baekduia sp.]
MTASALDGYRLAVRIRDRLFAAAVRRSFAGWGAGTVVQMPFRVEGEERIAIGADVFVGAGSWLQTIGDGRIAIGDGCQFSGQVVVSASRSIVLEPHVLVARNVHVLDHLHRFEPGQGPVHAQGITGERPVTIREGAWIGTNAVILPGVTIGVGAVVGANSVVRDDVPDWSVAVGAPARVVRRAEAPAPA